MESTHKKRKLNQDEIPRITYKWVFTDQYSHICKHTVDGSDHDRFTEINYNSN
jgi:hypothetical protein